MFIDLEISKREFLAVKVMPRQIPGGKKANCKTEGLVATLVPTWFSAVSDVRLPPVLRDVSRVLLACLQ